MLSRIKQWNEWRKNNPAIEIHLSGSDLSGSDLSGSDLSGSDLSGSDLSGSNLRGSDLRGSDLSGSNLSGSNLSGAQGVLSASDWLASNLPQDARGILAYKAFGKTSFSLPNKWIIAPGTVLEETPNPDRGTMCGCGVNVGTWDFVTNTYPDCTFWRVLVEWRDLADIVVPFNTTGKFRARRVTLLEVVA